MIIVFLLNVIMQRDLFICYITAWVIVQFMKHIITYYFVANKIKIWQIKSCALSYVYLMQNNEVQIWKI